MPENWNKPGAAVVIVLAIAFSIGCAAIGKLMKDYAKACLDLARARRADKKANRKD